MICEEKLAEEMPALNESMKAYYSMDKGDIYELKVIKKPTVFMCMVMEVACHMFELKPSKNNLKKYQNDTGGYFDMAMLHLIGKNPL